MNVQKKNQTVMKSLPKRI